MVAEHLERKAMHDNGIFERENYRDIRSAARSRRPRKRQDRRRCHSYRCRKEGQAYADMLNTKAKREIERSAVIDMIEEDTENIV